MANTQHQAGETALQSDSCSCCDSMQRQIANNWPVALEFWNTIRLLVCAKCSKFWHRFHETESRWRKVEHHEVAAIMDDCASHEVRTVGSKPNAESPVQDDVGDEEKIVPFLASDAA